MTWLFDKYDKVPNVGLPVNFRKERREMKAKTGDELNSRGYTHVV